MKAINSFLEESKVQIIKNADAQGRNKSGKIGDSMEVTQEGDVHTLLGWKWIANAWENGRGKTVNGGDGAVRRGVEKWVADNNITPRDNISTKSMIYLITRKIHEKGTQLHIQGGKSGVISNVINETRLNKLANDLAIEYSSEILRLL